MIFDITILGLNSIVTFLMLGDWTTVETGCQGEKVPGKFLGGQKYPVPRALF